MKIDGLIEEIFSQAVALDQSGRLRNTIYADKREIYILNYDHTVLLRFRLRSHESPFTEPISFKANDYDSNDFREEDGKIVFITEQNGFVRKKSCGRAEYTTAEVKDLFASYVRDSDNGEEVILNSKVISLLDQDLSHIEFIGEKGSTMKMIQRNIYSGGIIEIQEQGGGFFKNELKNDFGPIGIKTNDFISLFSFQDQDILKFRFPVRGKEDFITIKSMDTNKRDMIGVVACCLYDEIIKIQEVQNGRQEQKIRRRK
jgi:hypothetical protein